MESYPVKVTELSAVSWGKWLYTFGGIDDMGTPLTDCYTLDGVSFKWSQIGSLLSPRYQHASIQIDRRTIHHIGGIMDSGNGTM